MKAARKNAPKTGNLPPVPPAVALGLRVADQETARVVAVHKDNGEIVGAGCLIDDRYVLTCRHVVKAARKDDSDLELFVTLVGVEGRPTVTTEVLVTGGAGPENDLALLYIVEGPRLAVDPVEFASPLRHGDKAYSVLGFPNGDQQGRNATGFLHGADAMGLVQMDRGGVLSVLGGFSGAPVWCPDVNAFVGLVVTELANDGLSWCIPSRLLCQFFPDLQVRFRVPPKDRPQIHDYEMDDPNVHIYGTISDNGHRRLTVKVKASTDPDEDYVATATYECLPGSVEALGGFVTFITHPSYTSEEEDAYEVFAQVDENGRAEGIFYPQESFTLAAIGDGGYTSLTFDLKDVKKKPRGFE